jgi:hypothetical protein
VEGVRHFLLLALYVLHTAAPKGEHAQEEPPEHNRPAFWMNQDTIAAGSTMNTVRST